METSDSVSERLRRAFLEPFPPGDAYEPDRRADPAVDRFAAGLHGVNGFDVGHCASRGDRGQTPGKTLQYPISTEDT
jgi:hypothetical protein